MLSVIAAVSQNGVIGLDNSIPWKCKTDMKYFKDLTMDNIVIMGNKTFQSLFDHMKDSHNEPLPGRLKFVITNHPETFVMPYNWNNTIVIKPESKEDFIAYLRKHYPHKIHFVMGGTQIYEYFLGAYSAAYITRIGCNITPETNKEVVHYLPLKDSVLNSDFDLLYSKSVPADAENNCSMIFEQWSLKNQIGI